MALVDHRHPLPPSHAAQWRMLPRGPEVYGQPAVEATTMSEYVVDRQEREGEQLEREEEMVLET